MIALAGHHMKRAAQHCVSLLQQVPKKPWTKDVRNQCILSLRMESVTYLWVAPAQEDTLLLAQVKKVGDEDWHAIAAHFPSRTNKQCRDRWAPAVLQFHVHVLPLRVGSSCDCMHGVVAFQVAQPPPSRGEQARMDARRGPCVVSTVPGGWQPLG